MTSSRQLCTFSLGGLLFGVPVRAIQEIIRHHEMTRVPTASPIVRGLINLRGQVVLAVDLRYRLGMPPRSIGADSINVIVIVDDRPMSLLVDEIGDILDLRDELMESAPETIREEIRGFLLGIYKLPGRNLLALDVDRLATFDVTIEPAA